jgi:membrane protease YdiL (CAAX protease family)
VLLCVPYALSATSFGIFKWGWFAVYALLPVAIAFLLEQARNEDSAKRGNWRDFVVLLTLGLAVDLRWLEPAWPRGLAALGKILLLDAGIFGFLVVRRLEGVGFDLRLTLRDLRRGLGEYALYALIAIPLGLWLGFLHVHAVMPSPLKAVGAFVFTFLFIAIPEELFFRGWLQNLLERRMGRTSALLVTALLFGLAHWNKRTLNFNWRYVAMAAIAGLFYGRAWRAQRRVGAAAITHASVDTTWSLWLR